MSARIPISEHFGIVMRMIINHLEAAERGMAIASLKRNS